jgi:tRNA threonylcarbamoyladenosine biosynthesis protein TsaE
MKKITSRSTEETAVFAKNFLFSLKPKDKATVVALSGDLGSGKTTFTKEVANILGINRSEVTSPTFVIMKTYKLKPISANKNFQHLIHIDAYRLESEEELENLGWETLLQDPKNLILVEWPEMVPDCIPKTAQKIYFKFADENTRNIEIKQNGK